MAPATDIGLIFIISVLAGLATLSTEEKSWKEKDITDYNDADMERLLDQWEANDEDELEPDELPPYKRPPRGDPIDLSKIDPNDPEGLMRLTKKGQTVMMFVKLGGDPTKAETEEITKLWHTGLSNANYEVNRFVIDENRAIFMIQDGSLAWEIKDYLVMQNECEEVMIEQQIYYGKASPLYEKQQKLKKADIYGTPGLDDQEQQKNAKSKEKTESAKKDTRKKPTDKTKKDSKLKTEL